MAGTESRAQKIRQAKPMIYLVFVLALFFNVSFWMYSKHVRSSWANVPIAPTTDQLSMSGLGDDQIAYRMAGYTLQNMGNTGGLYESLKIYNYAELERWFFAAHGLDPNSGFVPFLAAYYFGAIEEPEKVKYLIPYLFEVGKSDYGEQWRWGAQAVYKARFHMKDLDLAMTMAKEMAKRDDVAPWVRQFPAFISLETGDKRAAYELIVAMLKSEGENLDPAEVNFMVDFICTRTLSKSDAAENPLCQIKR